MRIKGFAIFTITLLIAALVLSVAAAADQHSGTWKMNPAKSKYSPGPTPRSVTVKVDCDENGIKLDAEGTNQDGTPTHVEYQRKIRRQGLPDYRHIRRYRVGEAYRRQHDTVHFEKERWPVNVDCDNDGLHRRKNEKPRHSKVQMGRGMT